ncbi:MAG: DUF547 domain-containing protein [Candidatus Omnitrophota bacterium]
MLGIFRSVLWGAIFVVAVGFSCLPAYARQVNYENWQRVLDAYVDENGRVDYARLKDNRVDLDGFVRREIESAVLADLSPNAQKAFWINAYNALTMRLVVDNYSPKLKSIRSINQGRPWKAKMKVAGRETTLQDIEDKILRRWKPFDPRIHFAINCASLGCPKLPRRYFDPLRIDRQLDAQAKIFINDPEKVRFDGDKNILYYSSIFAWFKKDFLTVSPDLLSYIIKYLDTPFRWHLLSLKRRVKLKMLEYDWRLNKRY